MSSLSTGDAFRTDVFSTICTTPMNHDGCMEWPAQAIELIAYCLTRGYVTPREIVDAVTDRINALGRAAYLECLKDEKPLAEVTYPHALAFAISTNAIFPFEIRALPWRILEAQKDFILWFMPNMRQILTGVPVESYLFS